MTAFLFPRESKPSIPVSKVIATGGWQFNSNHNHALIILSCRGRDRWLSQILSEGPSETFQYDYMSLLPSQLLLSYSPHLFSSILYLLYFLPHRLSKSFPEFLCHHYHIYSDEGILLSRPIFRNTVSGYVLGESAKGLWLNN